MYNSPKEEHLKYLRQRLDRKLNWHKQIFAKWKQLGIALKSKLFTSNKLLIYKTIFKPILAYELQFWGTVSTCNTEILEQFKTLHMIVDAP
jgi:hypothetical protein